MAEAIDAQATLPPPVRAWGPVKDAHQLSLDLGDGSPRRLEFDFGGGVEEDVDVEAGFGSLTYLYGVGRGFAVGGQFSWTNLGYDVGVLDDVGVWTLDVVSAFQFPEKTRFHVTCFLGLGLSDGGDLHYQTGLVGCLPLSSNSVSLAPYLMFSGGGYDDGDAEVTIGSVRYGIQCHVRTQAGWAFSADLAIQRESWSVDLDAGGSGEDVAIGFYTAIGMQYTLP